MSKVVYGEIFWHRFLSKNYNELEIWHMTELLFQSVKQPILAWKQFWQKSCKKKKERRIFTQCEKNWSFCWGVWNKKEDIVWRTQCGHYKCQKLQRDSMWGTRRMLLAQKVRPLSEINRWPDVKVEAHSVTQPVSVCASGGGERGCQNSTPMMSDLQE